MFRIFVCIFIILTLFIGGCGKTKEETEQSPQGSNQSVQETTQDSGQNINQNTIKKQSKIYDLTEITDITGHPAEKGMRKALKKILPSGAVDITAEGELRPDDPITRGDMIAWMYYYNPLHIKPSNSSKSGFKDVKPSDKNYSVYQGLYNAGIAFGYEDSTLKPNQYLTREESALFVVRFFENYFPADNWASKPDIEKYLSSRYKDYKEIDKKYWPYVYEAYLSHMRDAFGDTIVFRPKAEVTRAEALTWISEHD